MVDGHLPRQRRPGPDLGHAVPEEEHAERAGRSTHREEIVNGVIVDGPSPNTGLLVDFLRDSYAADDPVLRTGHPEGLERRRESPYLDTLLRDYRPGRGGDACERGCSSRTYWWHACDVDQHTRCAGNYTGAPELSRCISNRCGAFDGRVHVWDAAAREWLLPRVAALSESKAASNTIRALIARMLAPDPSKRRPTFPELLEELT